MNFETLLEAAKYVEYHSEAKARGEEPHDYSTFSKLCSASKDGIFPHLEAQKRQPTLSNSSHSSEEIKDNRRRSGGQMTRDSVLHHDHAGTGTREVHNKLEKNRRAHLKECFEALKKQLPNMEERKTSNLSILRGAIRFIQVLKRKEREYEHDMEKLAREKIAFQQRLSILKKDLSSQLDHIDVNSFIPEEDNETTTTASECGNLSDFDDSLPPESSTLNSSSEFANTSSSSTAGGPRVGPVPLAAASAPAFVLSKQNTSGSHQAAISKDLPMPTPRHYPNESLLTVANKTPTMATPMSAVHHMNSTDVNAAQTARVFSTGNIHAMAGIFATPHAMQVITQPSGIKVITAPNSLMASNPSVQHISVSHPQHGQIHVLAPSSNAALSYASSIPTVSKAFSADSLVHVASSTTKSISRPHLVSPLALVTPQTMVGISHNSVGKPPSSSADFSLPAGSSASLNLSQKSGSVISGNMSMGVKSSMPQSSVVSCIPHSNMIATLQMSKAHSQIIQPTLTSSIIAQGGSHVNNGTHQGVSSSGLKSINAAPVRSLPHITGVAHVVVSQSQISTPVGQIVTPGSHVTPLVGSVSVMPHPGTNLHQQTIGKVLGTPVLKSVNQINQIPILQQQFLQQVSVGSSSQPIVKPVVVVSMPNVVSSNNMSPLTPTSLVTMTEQPGAVRGSSIQK